MTEMPQVQSASYASGVSSNPLLGDTIGANFDRTVARCADRDALVDCSDGRRWSYEDLAADVAAVALGLAGLGVAKGDRVGIWAPNCAEWVLVQYATAKLGAILVNINPAYRSHELAFVLVQSGLRTLVATPSFRSADYAAMIEEVRGGCAELRDVLLIGGSDWSELIAAGRRGDRSLLAEIASTLSPDDPINLQYTSGTTGFPKGATLSHHNILNTAISSVSSAATRRWIGSASPCPSTIVSEW